MGATAGAWETRRSLIQMGMPERQPGRGIGRVTVKVTNLKTGG